MEGRRDEVHPVPSRSFSHKREGLSFPCWWRAACWVGMSPAVWDTRCCCFFFPFLLFPFVTPCPQHPSFLLPRLPLLSHFITKHSLDQSQPARLGAPPDMSGFDIRGQNQPSHSSWNRAEEENDFWGYGVSSEHRHASRGWTSHDERANNSGHESLDDSWFTNDRPAPAPQRERLGSKSPLDAQGSSEDQRVVVKEETRNSIMPEMNTPGQRHGEEDMTKYWLKDDARSMIFGPKEPRRLFSAPQHVEQISDNHGWGSPSENVDRYHGDVNDIIKEQQQTSFWSKRGGEWVLLAVNAPAARARPGAPISGKRPGIQQGYDADKDDSECDSGDFDNNFFSTARPQKQQHHQKSDPRQVSSYQRPDTLARRGSVRQNWLSEDQWRKPKQEHMTEDTLQPKAQPHVEKVEPIISLWSPDSDSSESSHAADRASRKEEWSTNLVDLDFGSEVNGDTLVAEESLHGRDSAASLLSLDEVGKPEARALVRDSSIIESLQGLMFEERPLIVQETCLDSSGPGSKAPILDSSHELFFDEEPRTKTPEVQHVSSGLKLQSQGIPLVASLLDFDEETSADLPDIVASDILVTSPAQVFQSQIAEAPSEHEAGVATDTFHDELSMFDVLQGDAVREGLVTCSDRFEYSGSTPRIDLTRSSGDMMPLVDILFEPNIAPSERTNSVQQSEDILGLIGTQMPEACSLSKEALLLDLDAPPEPGTPPADTSATWKSEYNTSNKTSSMLSQSGSTSRNGKTSQFAGYEFASSHEWLAQIANDNRRQFSESRAENREQWKSLMAKQEEDSRKIEEFIQKTTVAKASPPALTTDDTKECSPPEPFTVKLTVETKNNGHQIIQATEKDDLKTVVEEFCSKFDMVGYDMALWVMLAAAINDKKEVRRSKVKGAA